MYIVAPKTLKGKALRQRNRGPKHLPKLPCTLVKRFQQIHISAMISIFDFQKRGQNWAKNGKKWIKGGGGISRYILVMITHLFGDGRVEVVLNKLTLNRNIYEIYP